MTRQEARNIKLQTVNFDNELVADAMRKAMSEYAEEYQYLGRLYHCNAEVYKTKNWYILKSYQTFVACTPTSDGNILLKGYGYDFLLKNYGKRTTSSSQQIHKFFKKYARGN